ncbi:glycosyltransferase [Streptomyces sp. LZ34]
MAGVRAVVVDPAGSVTGAGENILLRPHVPQLPLLARVDAVVCHAGHNTVCEALWHGVPLVVAPIRDDQPIVAGQVTDAGAGVRLRFGRADTRRRRCRRHGPGRGVGPPRGGAVGRSFVPGGRRKRGRGRPPRSTPDALLLRHSTPAPGRCGQGPVVPVTVSQ